ncbi:MAG: hypothetical protein KKA84_12020 [Bacteroidetes bacterium]|nr:hypothetical protein [Bacteroidota bacterium]
MYPNYLIRLSEWITIRAQRGLSAGILAQARDLLTLADEPSLPNVMLQSMKQDVMTQLINWRSEFSETNEIDFLIGEVSRSLQ